MTNETNTVTDIALPEGNPVTLLVRSYPSSEGCGDEPKFAVVVLTPELLNRVYTIKRLVQVNQLSSATTYDSVEEWGPNDCRLVSDTMSVSSCSFWFEANVKHGDYDVATAGIYFNMLQEAFQPGATAGNYYHWFNDILVLATDPQELYREYTSWKNGDDDMDYIEE